ncbi:MAG: ChbG/HpnK family deacetylase [Planctomycetes bacterium]|nr:ChbG/HpnK family deacetylase [Planctomycetota bacterium]
MDLLRVDGRLRSPVLAFLLSAGLALLALRSRAAAEGPVPFEKRELAVELGYAAGTKLLLVNADDAGLCAPVNEATLEVLRDGLAGSATVLVPAPAVAAFAARASATKGLDLGVHLCLNGEWGERLKMAPVLPAADVPSLIDSSGLFPASIVARDRRARPKEAAAEFRAQIERAKSLGLDPTHVDAHMGSYNYRPDLLQPAMGVALACELPMRVVFFVPDARRRGIPCPDRFAMFYDAPVPNRKETYLKFLRSLRPGVTELAIHVAKDDAEWRAVDPEQGAFRVADLAIFLDAEVRRTMESEGIVRIGWRPLRALMRRWKEERVGARPATGEPQAPGGKPGEVPAPGEPQAVPEGARDRATDGQAGG